MANPEHVEIVRQGKEAIAEWRGLNSEKQFDLSGADLSETNLSGADRSWANLKGVNLKGARLSGPSMIWAGPGLFKTDETESVENHVSAVDMVWANRGAANLAGAYLAGAHLANTTLSGVSLLMADLARADLSNAHLWASVFSSTNLNQAQFRGARFGYTVLGDCDLSATLGLETVNHEGPSTIGLDTIIKSGGNITEVFLRGAGVPDSTITYVRSLVAQPSQFYTCFISYAHQDQAFADRLYADLQAKGIRCWYYPESATMGRRVWEDIDRSIRIYDKLVVICSEASLNSPAVVEEIDRALGKEEVIGKDNAQRRIDAAAKGEEPRLTDPDVLFPIFIDRYVFDHWQHHRKHNVTSRNIGDFSLWDTDVQKYQDSLNRLLHALDPKSWPAVV